MWDSKKRKDRETEKGTGKGKTIREKAREKR